jgi:hypothetical protein
MEENTNEIVHEDGRLAFLTLQPELDALSYVRRANTDMDKAVVHAASVGRWVKQPEVRARFASLPASDFDIRLVDLLELVALANWYCSVELRSASVSGSGAKIPASVLDEAARLKEVMFVVVEYNLGHLPEVADELADIRRGSGYLDTARDLLRLVKLYEKYAAELAIDQRRYQAADAVAASRVGHTIHQVLGDGRSTDARYWSNYLTRSWSLLVDTYAEVSAAGRWLFRHENGEARFPSLYTIGRQRRSRAPDEDPSSPDDKPDDGGVIVDPAIPQT